jgi:hypothetical protein
MVVIYFVDSQCIYASNIWQIEKYCQRPASRISWHIISSTQLVKQIYSIFGSIVEYNHFMFQFISSFNVDSYIVVHSRYSHHRFTIFWDPGSNVQSSVKPNIVLFIALFWEEENWGGISLLFFFNVPTRLSLSFFNKSSAEGILVNRLSVVTFLPVPWMGWTNLFTTACALLLCWYGPGGWVRT